MAEREAAHDLTAPSGDGEVSVVMPCLNQAVTLAACIGKALDAIRKHGIAGEAVVADNGSTDASVRIAVESGG